MTAPDGLGPIDAVVAWVDGDDPAHVAKRLRYGAQPNAGHTRARDATRFAARGEIHWCLSSILRFLPWTRRIWLVTDDQVPPGLERYGDRVTVVDHRTIFAGHEDRLPTFSSPSIGAMLWRIPDLAERFIYFNDDVFACRPLRPEDFFDGPRPLVRGRLYTPRRPRLLSRLRDGLRHQGLWPQATPRFNTAAVESARLLGRTEVLQPAHVPHALRRSTLQTYFAARPDVLDRQIAHRFRHVQQFSAVALAGGLELEAGAPLSPMPPLVYIDPPAGPVPEEALSAIRDGTVAFGCIQSLDRAEEATLARIRAVMDAAFP